MKLQGYRKRKEEINKRGNSLVEFTAFGDLYNELRGIGKGVKDIAESFNRVEVAI